MPEHKLLPYDTTYKSNAFTDGNGNAIRIGSFSFDFSNAFFVGHTSTDPNYEENSEEVSIVVKPQSVTPNLVDGGINLGPHHTYVNNKLTRCGELSIVLKNHLKDVDFYIDRYGNLVVSGENAKNYDINSNGELIYTNR